MRPGARLRPHPPIGHAMPLPCPQPCVLPTPTHVLYLHGFRSSPASAKAQQVAAALRALARPGEAPLVWQCPQLPPSPSAVLALLETLTQDWPSQGMAVIGSSLGGFFATIVAQRKACRAALINPAVNPARDLAAYIGELSHFHDPHSRFSFTRADVEVLAQASPYPITEPQRYWLLAAQGDEVLDYREMLSHYPGAHQRVLPASDHAVSDFEQHLPAMLAWLGWPTQELDHAA